MKRKGNFDKEERKRDEENGGVNLWRE